MQTTLSKSSRTIASFSAHFTSRTRVECVLHIVRSGSVERVCSHLMMRSANATPSEHNVVQPWEMTVTVWMTEQSVGRGETKYSLESTGCWGSRDWHSEKEPREF